MVKYKTDIHRKDYDTQREYNKERMKIVNRAKALEERKLRWEILMDILDDYKANDWSREDIIDDLAKHGKYKLVIKR